MPSLAVEPDKQATRLPTLLTQDCRFRGILSLMLSANTDPELRHWLRWAAEEGNTPMFVRTVAEAALIACSPDYELLRPVLVELERRHRESLTHRKIQNVRI